MKGVISCVLLYNIEKYNEFYDVVGIHNSLRFSFYSVPYMQILVADLFAIPGS